MSETIYQESTGNYKYKGYSGICKGCGKIVDIGNRMRGGIA